MKEALCEFDFSDSKSKTTLWSCDFLSWFYGLGMKSFAARHQVREQNSRQSQALVSVGACSALTHSLQYKICATPERLSQGP